MKILNFKVFGIILILSACADKQIAPDLPKHASSEFQVQTLADGLSAPWSVVSLGDNSYLVTERTGGLKHILPSGNTVDITGLPNDIYVNQQGGLFEIALSPNYQTDKTVYLSYAMGTKKANHTALYKARLEGNELVDGKGIFQASPTKDTASHFGGRITFLPDETLLLSLGEGFAYREAAQDKASHLGKIIRIHTDGSVPNDNPFVGISGVRPEIYSLGHRNVQGLHYDGVGGVLWATEHGPKGGDELNIIKVGANYGWPLATTGVDYNGAKITPHKTYEGTQKFTKDWVPSIAPSSLMIYRGEKFPGWNGDAFVGGLASLDLRRIDLEDGKFISEEILLHDLEARIRDVKTAVDGALLIVLDDAENGKVLRITPKG